MRATAKGTPLSSARSIAVRMESRNCCKSVAAASALPPPTLLSVHVREAHAAQQWFGERDVLLYLDGARDIGGRDGLLDRRFPQADRVLHQKVDDLVARIDLD